MILSFLLPKMVCYQTVDAFRRYDFVSSILMSYAYIVRSDPALLSNTTSQDEFEATLLPFLDCVRQIRFSIEDVERGRVPFRFADSSRPLRGPCIIGRTYSFSGPLRGPLTLHHRQILFLNDQILVSDRRTDGRTDAINIFWAFLVKN